MLCGVKKNRVWAQEANTGLSYDEERGNLGKGPVEGHQIQSVGFTFGWETVMRKSDI